MEAPRWVPVPVFMKNHPEAGKSNFVYRQCGDDGVFQDLTLRLGGKLLIRDDALEILADRQRAERAEAGIDLATEG